MAVIAQTLYSDLGLIPNKAAEEIEIKRICRRLSGKYFSDEELDIFAAHWFPRIATSRLLSGLSSYFDDIISKEDYNRNAQANITRLMLRFLAEIYKPARPTVLEPVPVLAKENPLHAFFWRASSLIVNIVRYPLYIFTRIFGSLNLAVSTFTSLDRSFWIPFFPHVTLSFLITLPIDLLFIATAVFQFQWFECSLFANALKVGHKKEIEPALKADRTTIKVTSLYNEELIRLKQSSREVDSPGADVSTLLDGFSRKFSHHVLSKESNYQEYKEPLRKKLVRWGLNMIGGFLVCCLNAFTFKYTIAAFASSHAVTTLMPWLSALLCTPAAITILTAAAVVYGLVYYSAKRINSPDHYHLKFTHNRNKLNTFKRVWVHQENCLQQHEVIYRLGLQNRILFKKKLRDTYSEVFAEIRGSRALSLNDAHQEEKVFLVDVDSPPRQFRSISPVIQREEVISFKVARFSPIMHERITPHVSELQPGIFSRASSSSLSESSADETAGRVCTFGSV